jgi:hypothetical protein
LEASSIARASALFVCMTIPWIILCGYISKSDIQLSNLIADFEFQESYGA